MIFKGTVKSTTPTLHSRTQSISVESHGIDFNGPTMRLIGSDISWIPGFFVPGILYVLFEPRLREQP
jgi:hypothetical protein